MACFVSFCIYPLAAVRQNTKYLICARSKYADTNAAVHVITNGKYTCNADTNTVYTVPVFGTRYLSATNMQSVVYTSLCVPGVSRVYVSDRMRRQIVSNILDGHAWLFCIKCDVLCQYMHE